MKFTSLILLFSLTVTCSAQISAITDTGNEVLLFNNGTWQFLETTKNQAHVITENPNPFTKAEKSSFLLKSTKLNVGFWINPQKWNFKKAVQNEEAEYELTLKIGDLYSMIISEKMEMPIATLRDLALENARSIAPDIKVVQEEFRVVNGVKVFCMQMNGTIQGIKFSYFSYYYTNSTGSVQFVTYTSQKLLNEFMEEIEELLNGFVVLE